MSGPSFDHQQQQHHSMMMKRPWQEKTLKNHYQNNDDQRFNSAEFYAKLMGRTIPPTTHMARLNVHGFPRLEDDLMSKRVPQVTVVLEGRSICQRISLDKHLNYHSLAKALRQMFVDENEIGSLSDIELNLSNAIPGHVIAYEDFEDDLLLAGDLNYRDFVRVAKRIRIIPVKANSRRGRIEA
ncbi:Iaa33p [Ranunculus cassubicifolius]